MIFLWSAFWKAWKEGEAARKARQPPFTQQQHITLVTGTHSSHWLSGGDHRPIAWEKQYRSRDEQCSSKHACTNKHRHRIRINAHAHTQACNTQTCALLCRSVCSLSIPSLLPLSLSLNPESACSFSIYFSLYPLALSWLKGTNNGNNREATFGGLIKACRTMSQWVSGINVESWGLHFKMLKSIY